MCSCAFVLMRPPRDFSSIDILKVGQCNESVLLDRAADVIIAGASSDPTT